MLNGHLDVNSLTLGGTRDPWTPIVEGNRLYGHGVQNMKGGVAATISAAEAVRRAGVTLRGELVVWPVSPGKRRVARGHTTWSSAGCG